ncbi:MAG: hypothetical protein ACREQY_17470 [Candidatus Binatia bacterium]
MTRGAHDPAERFARVAATIRDDLVNLERLVAEAVAASTRFAEAEPSRLELRGIGAIVHDFYTGIERLFETIAPELNGGIPASPSWHRELLQNMTLDLPGIRPPVVTKATAHLLGELLRFRHLFRNVYGFDLEWARLGALLGRLPVAGRALRQDVERFLAFLDEASSPAPKG